MQMNNNKKTHTPSCQRAYCIFTRHVTCTYTHMQAHRVADKVGMIMIMIIIVAVITVPSTMLKINLS